MEAGGGRVEEIVPSDAAKKRKPLIL